MVSLWERRIVEGYNASDEKSVADAKAAAGRYQKRLDTAVAEMLNSPNGRFWIWDLLKRCNILSTPFRPGDHDSTSFGLGGQNIGIQLFAQISRASPDLFGLMMKENSDV